MHPAGGENKTSPELPGVRQIWEARKRIRPSIYRTPLIYSAPLSDRLKGEVYLKLENLQEIGAFKIRGAANKILSLPEEERRRGVTTYSTGNHAQAVASMAGKAGIPAVVCLSNRVPEAKKRAIARWGAEIRVTGSSQDDAEAYCRKLAEEEGMVLVDPFDDPFVIAGQGTIGLEILEDLPDVASIIVPTSGGGLISGISAAVRTTSPEVTVTGVSMERGAVMHASLEAGHPVVLEESDTLADSLLGGIGLENRYTFRLVQRYVSRIVLLPEEEIARGMAFLLKYHKMMVEGAAATGVGALLSGAVTPEDREKTVIIVTGNNVNPEAFLDSVKSVYTI